MSEDEQQPDPPDPPDPPGSRLVDFAGLGLQLAVTLTIGVLGGLWLDQRFELSPVFTLVGSFGALAAVFYQLFKIADRFS